MFIEDQIISLEYYYAPYPLFGSPDDEHPRFDVRQIAEEEATSFLLHVKQIDVPVEQTIKDIVLVKDYSDVIWHDRKDTAIILKAIILKLESQDIAFQGDYMIPLIEIFRGESVIDSLLPAGEEFYSDEEVTYQGSREFVSLAKPN